MLRLFFLLFLAAVTSLLSAQAPLWSAEVEVVVDTEVKEDTKDPFSRFLDWPDSLLQNKESNLQMESLGWQIAVALLEGDLKAYKDPLLKYSLDTSVLQSIWNSTDTLVVFDPVSLEPILEEVTDCPSPIEFYKIRIRIRLEYFENGEIQQTILSGNLREVQFDANGNELPPDRPVYFSVLNSSRPLEIEKWSIIDLPKVTFKIEEAIASQNESISTDSLLQHLINATLSADDGNFRTTDGTFGPLSEEDRFQINDELVYEHPVPDPVTLEPIVEAKAAPFDPRRIEKICLLQYWAWDAERSEPVILPIGYAPLKSVYDEAGNHLYDLPLFYWIPERFRE
ncbi:MAG: hypothetical protein AAF433_04805 [Bacteroidota bacterium]